MKIKILFFVAAVFSHLTFAQLNHNALLPLDWQLGYSTEEKTEPKIWIPSTVPGAVQLDIAHAQNWGPFYYAENWKQYLPLENNFYTYRSTFNRPDSKKNDRVFFVSLGIDYEFSIFLNKELLLHQEGMFTAVKIDITTKLKDINTIEILVFPAPKSHAKPADRSQADHSVKPPLSYGWDWHPRLIPLGIWDETGLSLESSAFLEEFTNNYELNGKMDQASLNITLKGRNLSQYSYIWKLTDDKGTIVLIKEGNFETRGAEFSATIIKPKLWWPYDQGKPALYNSTIYLKDNQKNIIQSITERIGFRRIKLVLNTGTQFDPEGFPKSRRLPPIQMQVNGRNIFCKGTNWLNPEVFPGTITEARYNELLSRVVDANFNILRVWGGGIVNKESFFKLCDEKGILVWQEFPLACNNYPDDAHYLSILKQEATSIILRLKRHPSLALWCGGNELFNSWSGMNDQSLAIRLLNSLCYELDPSTPFNATSPLQGMGHGNYIFRDNQTRTEVYARMNNAKFTAYTEFGVPSPSSVEILKSIIPEAELWPPRPGGSWESHHAFNSWIPETWLMQNMIEDYFGKSANLDELVKHGQLLQAEGYKYIFEESRRQKPFCSMAINWCYNEPWPTAANNNIISYPAIPKPAFYEVRNACRPILASATIDKFVWNPGEQIKTTVWILNDSPTATVQMSVNVALVEADKKLPLGHWDFIGEQANKNKQGAEFTGIIPDWPAGIFKLVVEVEGHPELSSVYQLILKK
jgi:beta-mannosidase